MRFYAHNPSEPKTVAERGKDVTVFESIVIMPRPPATQSSVAMTCQQLATTTQTPSHEQSVTRLQQLKDEAEMQQLQMQHMQQQQQFQLQQQAQMQQLQHQQAQLQQQSMQFPQGMDTASGTLASNATVTNLASAAVQAASNAANAAAAGGATAGGGFAFPRNSPEFACENVGERVKGKRRKYCPHEVTALVLGVQRYADDSCPWSSILRDPHLGHLFHGRSGVDLKDKWRTLIKTRPELAAYTENRKNHRKYRPFSATEERALLEGVKKYNGQRNVWSLILIDKELGPQFNDRSNVQLKDKFRTMRRAGTTTALLISGGACGASRRTSTVGTPKSEDRITEALTTKSDATSRTLARSPAAVLTAVSAAVNGTSRVPASMVSASQQAATLLVQNNNAASAMFADPSLYLAGSFSMPPHMSQGMSIQQMTTTQSRQQTAQAQAQAQAHAQAQAQAHAQAQAIANAQARAAQAQLEAQIQHIRAHGGQQQVTIKQQYQALNAHNSAFSASVPGYQLVGNQIVPQQAIYFQNAQSQQHVHLQQQQIQQQIQQRQLQQQQQQQQLAAAIAAASSSSHPQQQQQQQQPQQKSLPTSTSQSSGTSRGASLCYAFDVRTYLTNNNVDSMKVPTRFRNAC
ncbi:hypothetical protein PsorP6_016016 [Peronosclerospora sorghi]|uniref:Uncharacterized protein n=1 Tax=Peronosclerospora sorghi TaxID=230839 RepID=A0ACC0WMD6_9STRA|nr:hypothetical protein PsorP6_016016 [Peronosclerospora sorghi]